jgi:hypothetical protein
LGHIHPDPIVAVGIKTSPARNGLNRIDRNGFCGLGSGFENPGFFRGKGKNREELAKDEESDSHKASTKS